MQWTDRDIDDGIRNLDPAADVSADVQPNDDLALASIKHRLGRSERGTRRRQRHLWISVAGGLTLVLVVAAGLIVGGSPRTAIHANSSHNKSCNRIATQAAHPTLGETPGPAPHCQVSS